MRTAMDMARTPRHRRPWALRYGCAAATVAAALYGTNALGETLAGVSPLFFAAVAVSAWYGGLWPGVLATALAGLASAFFLFEPVYSLHIGWDDLIRVSVLMLVATLIGLLQEAMRRAQGKAAEATEQAVAANRAKDRFIAVLSHELRNPLNPILTVATVLESDARLPEDLREDLAMIRRNAELEARLVDDLLDLNRTVRGKLAMCLDVVDAHALVRDVIDMVGPDASGKGVDLSARLAADRHHLYADAGRLRQVLWNLLRNSVKFTPPGGRVTVTSSGDGNGGLRLDVTDTGVGIDPQALPRIFDAFEQADETVAKRFGGLGLGLAISRNIVASHGGALDGASPGKGMGATFTLRLPTVDPPRHEPALPRAGRFEGEEWPPRRPPMPDARAPLRILLVEDHADTARAMCRLLRDKGHDVAQAGSVREALRAGERRDFDLLIGDLTLPDGSGHEVVRRLRARCGGAIALSGHTSEDDWRQGYEAGFDDFLTKPVTAETLEAAILRVAGCCTRAGRPAEAE